MSSSDSAITPLTPEQQKTAEQQTAHEGFIHRELVAIDMLGNVTTGGNNDETISSRMARWDVEDTGVKHEVGHLISEGLDLIQKNHGAQAMAGDLERTETVAKLETSDGVLPSKK